MNKGLQKYFFSFFFIFSLNAHAKQISGDIFLNHNEAEFSNGNNTFNTTPVAIASSDVTSGCTPLSVNFINNSLNATNYSWDFGDGSALSTDTAPSHIYTAPGNYIVMLIASSAGGADTDSVFITVNGSPGLNFGADTITSTAHSYLLDAGAGNASYLWSSGDTTQSITIDSIGSYCVTVTAANGCTASDCVYVIINTTIASASSVDTSGCPPLTTHFANHSLHASNYTWNFGDGSPNSTTTSPSHIYTSAGIYIATLIAYTGIMADTDSITIHVYAGPLFSFIPDTIVSLTPTYNLDAGSGYSTYYWSTNAITQSITIDSTGSYCVTVGNVQGCHTSDCVYVIVNNLVADASSADTAGCSPHTVHFINNSLHTTNYTWNFGDGSALSHAIAPVHVYSTPGTYTAILIASLSSLSDTDSLIIHVYGGPSFNFIPDTITSSVATYYLDAGPGYSSYHWNTGDTTQAITIDSTGYYCMTVTNVQGCSGSDCVFVVVNNLVASASVNDTTGCAPYSVQFMNNSQHATNYTWNFGDGSPVSHGITPTHVYINAGTYVASLIATVGALSDTDFVTIHVNASPAFNIIPDTITSNSSTYFLDAGGGYTSYYWSTTATTQAITVDSTGYYCVTVFNPLGCHASDCVFVIVHTLVAHASAVSTSGCSPMTVSFINNSVQAFNYSWNFGDGSAVSHAFAPTHVYIFPGTFTAILIASVGSLADTDSVTIHVAPSLVFSFPTDTITTNNTSQLLDAGPGYSTYLWSTGATTQSITVTSIASYCVTVSNATGCTTSDCVFVNLNVLHAGIYTIDTAGCGSLTVTFTNNSLHASTYTWDFGDGSPVSNAFAPPHYYSFPGDFIAKLIAYYGGASDTDSIKIHVYPLPVINFGSDTLYPYTVSYLLNAGNPGSAFSWSTGDTTQTILVDSVGLYCVMVTSAEGCVDSNCVFVIVDPTGIQNTENNSASLYPDPADDYFILSSGNDEKIHLAIFNSLGRLIYKNDFSKSKIISTRNWPEGVYFIKSTSFSKVLVVNH